MEKNIYLLKSGICCNDIKNSLDEEIKNKSNLNILKKDSTNNNELTNNGAYELLMLKKNQKLKNIFDENTIVFTSGNDIESSLIFASNFNIKTVYPILNLSDNKNFKKLRDIKDFKNHYGKNNNVQKYWNSDFNHNKLNIELLNLKNDIPKISWKYYEAKYLSDYKKFSFSKFLKFFKELLDTNIQFKTVVFIGSNKLINNFLKKSLNKQYNKKKNITEYSSIYEINVKYDRKIIVESYEKIYPTKFNSYPLQITNDNNYKYSFNNKSYKLVNSSKKIPINMILKYNLVRCFNKDLLNKYLNSLKTNNDKKQESKDINFEKIIKLVNK